MADPGDEAFDERGSIDRFISFVRARRWQFGMSAVAALALLAIVLSVYALTEARRDLLRISTDIAQLKVSLDLFSRQIQGNGPGGQSLVDLSNRLIILEENWREGLRQQRPLSGAAGPPAAAAPNVAPDPAAPAAAGPNADGAGLASSPLEECIPSGTRFLAMQNDSYPVCGTTQKVALSAIGSGSVVLADGSTILAGNSGTLAGTACIVAVLSAESDGAAGFAELRITC